MRKYLAEGIGTMFLVLLACGSAVLAAAPGAGNIGAYGVGVCFGLILIVLCYAIGNISGCHVNPAVSFAMLLAGKIKGKDFVCYVAAQLIGAAVGAAFLYALTNMGNGAYDFGGITKIDGTVTGTIAANTLQPGATAGMALLAECLLTFLFVFVILGATDEKLGFGKFAGLAIGIALGLVNIVGIPVDNCSVNPARSFGPALFSQGAGAWGDFWIMVVGPLVGAAIAVLCWKAVANTCKNSIE